MRALPLAQQRYSPTRTADAAEAGCAAAAGSAALGCAEQATAKIIAQEESTNFTALINGSLVCWAQVDSCELPVSRQNARRLCERAHRALPKVCRVTPSLPRRSP